jgi:transcriptional regulator with XRE-family HTH domain
MATRDLDRLAKAVKARRLELYPSRLKAAEVAGVSKDTWQKVEDGKPAREGSYAKIERALNWVTGGCLLVAEGGQPIHADYIVADGDVTMVTHPPASWADEDAVRRVVSESAVATMPGTPVGEVQAFSDRIIEELRKRGMIRGPE